MKQFAANGEGGRTFASTARCERRDRRWSVVGMQSVRRVVDRGGVGCRPEPRAFEAIIKSRCARRRRDSAIALHNTRPRQQTADDAAARWLQAGPGVRQRDWSHETHNRLTFFFPLNVSVSWRRACIRPRSRGSSVPYLGGDWACRWKIEASGSPGRHRGPSTRGHRLSSGHKGQTAEHADFIQVRGGASSTRERRKPVSLDDHLASPRP